MIIQSNVKGRVELNIDHQHIIIHGRNGGGKSAVVHSIELACFGGVYDAAGRDVKQKGLVQHVAAPGEELRSHVTFNCGLSCTWPTKNQHGLINPLAITAEAMTGSTSKLLIYLLQNMDDDHEVKLDYANWDAVVKRHGGYRTALIEMYENCSSSVRSVQKRLRDHSVVKRYLAVAGDLPSIQALYTTIREDEKALSDNKELLEQIETEMSAFVRGALPGLEQKMLPFIPDGMDAPKFVWLEGQLRLGFEGRPVPSGAESIALAIALAVVTVPDESDSRHVWILPDRAYDPITLGNIMRVLRSLFCRAVVIQTTVLPRGYDYLDYGWEAVEV
jgi:hypothetical protein